MNDPGVEPCTKAQLVEQIEELRRRLEEAEQALEAIRTGDVDALVVAGPQGEQIYSLTGAEHTYRVIVESMNEAALTVDPDGMILFCNQRFCDLMKTPIRGVMGRKVIAFAARPQQRSLKKLLTQALVDPMKQRLVLRAADGAAVLVQLSAGPLRAGDSLSICLVASDLTELEESAASIRVLREHEQALQEANERLQRQSEELQAQTEQLRAQTEGLTATEAALRESEYHLACAQQIAHLGSWSWDIAEDRLYWSDETYRLYGLQPGESTPRHEDFMNFVHPEDRQRVENGVREAFARGGLYHLDFRIVRRGGEERYVHCEAQTLLDPQGHPTKAEGALQDITERKRVEEALRESEDRLRVALDAGRMGTWVWDLATDAVNTDPLHRRLWDLDEADARVPASAILQRIHPADRARAFDRESFDRESALQMGTGPYDIEFRVLRRDGSITWLQGSAVPVRDAGGVLRKVIGVNFDITERKQAEEALREWNAMLESRVARRTTELQHRARQLQRLTLEISETEDRERRRMAEILHDDLQQQLAAAKFHLSLLRGRVKHDASAQATAAQIDHMLMETIQRSRSLSHELSPAVLHHGGFSETLRWLANQIRAKHGLIVHVQSHGKDHLQSDTLKGFLYKAAQELLFNIIKHAHVKEANVRVRRMGRYLCLAVADCGRGFDPQGLREAAGFGLLSIRERIELLGGRMRIKSARGKGSTFFIVVPDGAPAGTDSGVEPKSNARANGTGHAAAENGGRLRVLLADDHVIVRQGLVSLLSEERTIEIVGEAANGREAVDLTARFKPDVVIMDVSMPLVDGDEATRQIKRQLPKTRVIALSMYEEPARIEAMRRAGAERYVLKTAPSEDLLAAIRGTEAPASGESPGQPLP